MKSIRIILLIICLNLLMVMSYAQQIAVIQDLIARGPSAAAKIRSDGFDFFATDELLQMTLAFNAREFLKTKSKPEYVDAALTIRLSETDSLFQPIRIKARGEMRRSYCAFPPLMLKFKGNGSDSGNIQEKGKLKLVTHCNPTACFEMNVLKEYLIYRMFNLVTPYSFKTRLARITYVDREKPNKAYTTYGFLIEDEDKMAERNNGVLIKALNATQKDMVSLDMARIAVFNYMVGNTDWSVPYQHNIKIMKTLEAPSDKAIPVVYDFDYSGLVNAIYAAPFEELPIKDVTERYYMGMCGKEEELNTVIDEFSELKDDFINTVNSFEYLTKNEKKYVLHYLNGFYEGRNFKNYLISDLNRTCKSF